MNEWTIVIQDVSKQSKMFILPSSNLSAQECTLVNTMFVRSTSDNKKKTVINNHFLLNYMYICIL